MHLAVLLEGQCIEGFALFDAQAHETTGDSVGVAEGDAFGNEVIRAVGGVEEACRGSGAHAFGEEGCRFQHRRQHIKAEIHRIQSVEHSLLVLLQIFVVGERQALDRRQKRGQRAIDAARFAADQFCQVGIFFLRHDGGASGEAVVQRHKTEFPRAPQADFLCKARKMRHEDGKIREQFQHEIAISDGVEAVFRHAVHAELFGHELPVERVARAGQRAGAQGRGQRARAALGKAFAVAQKHLRIGHEVVRQRHRLRPLQMRIARHDGIQMLFRHIAQGLDEKSALFARSFDLVAEVEAQIQRHLIVAAAGGVQFLARLADAPG